LNYQTTTTKGTMMVNLTKPQRLAVRRIHLRVLEAQKPSAQPISYRAFRRKVQPGPDCAMLPYAGMWLGIEHDGYTHS
jgi:hypothetical protein